MDAVGLVGKGASISMMSEWLSDLSWWKDVVHVLQEGFILDLVVSENKADAFALLSGSPVQSLQVLHQVEGVVGTKNKACKTAVFIPLAGFPKLGFINSY